MNYFFGILANQLQFNYRCFRLWCVCCVLLHSSTQVEEVAPLPRQLQLHTLYLVATASLGFGVCAVCCCIGVPTLKGLLSKLSGFTYTIYLHLAPTAVFGVLCVLCAAAIVLRGLLCLNSPASTFHASRRARCTVQSSACSSPGPGRRDKRGPKEARASDASKQAGAQAK